MSSDSPSGPATPSKGEGLREVQADVPSCFEPPCGRPDAPPHPERCNVLLVSLLSLFVIGFVVWLVSGGKRYREEYAEATQGWRVGSTRALELTLVEDDESNLACASDQVVAGLHCGYRSDEQEGGSSPSDDPRVLQPYNTVKSELLLGAGLWSSSDLKGPLPAKRFTVVCSYHINGVMRSAAIRFKRTRPFVPLRKTVTFGTLTDCMIPR
jgi:hypothetical protein